MTRWNPSVLVRVSVLFALAVLACAMPQAVNAQAHVTTFGVQVKPVVPLDFFDPVSTAERPSLTGTAELTGGYAFGMSVRIGLTNTISLETGLGQIQRRYRFNITNDTSGYSESDNIRYIGYELPVTGLVYIRLGQRTWMNAALGFSVDMYPSDAQRDIAEGRIYLFRTNWAQMGILGNLGVEYRTERSGTFYLGATFHRPFNPMAQADFTYYYFGQPSFQSYTTSTTLSGSGPRSRPVHSETAITENG
ncbi:MAG: outer membrane beta-barrel protein, partial [Flavobacteriales bacterium]